MKMTKSGWNKAFLTGMTAMALVLGLVIGCENPTQNKNDGNKPGGDGGTIGLPTYAAVNFPTTSTNPDIQALINQTTGYLLTIEKAATQVYSRLIGGSETTVTITLTTGTHVFNAVAMKNTESLGTGSVIKTLVHGTNQVTILLGETQIDTDVTLEWENPEASDAVVTTFAGGTSFGYADGAGSAAQFYYPGGVVVDSFGNVYVGDSDRIRKITSGGLVSTLAGGTYSGYADGAGSAALFGGGSSSVAVDQSGNVYVADTSNNVIRKITSSGVVTTLAGGTRANAWDPGYADGTGTAAQFYQPSGVAVDAFGNIYVADRQNNRIRKITSSGVVTTLAGNTSYGYADGAGTAAQFSYPSGIAVDPSGNNIYVADSTRIRKITSGGQVTTFAGNTLSGYADGAGTAAQFSYLNGGIALDPSGNVYVADTQNNVIRKITSSGLVTTLAGGTRANAWDPGYADGTGSAAQFYRPGGVAVDSSGNVYVADTNNNNIRKITQ